MSDTSLVEAVKSFDREITKEIREKIFATFITLAPSAKVRVSSPEVQSKMLTGFISVLRLYTSDDKTWTERAEWVQKSHKKMQIEESEIKAYCNALKIVINVELKFSEGTKEKIHFIIDQTEKFMLSKKDKGGCIVQ